MPFFGVELLDRARGVAASICQLGWLSSLEWAFSSVTTRLGPNRCRQIEEPGLRTALSVDAVT